MEYTLGRCMKWGILNDLSLQWITLKCMRYAQVVVCETIDAKITELTDLNIQDMISHYAG